MSQSWNDVVIKFISTHESYHWNPENSRFTERKQVCVWTTSTWVLPSSTASEYEFPPSNTVYNRAYHGQTISTLDY